MRVERWSEILGRVVRIRVSCECPPVPSRKFDWLAVDDDHYDGAPDSGHAAHVIGNGETDEDAITDLLAQMEDDPENHGTRQEGEMTALDEIIGKYHTTDSFFRTRKGVAYDFAIAVLERAAQEAEKFDTMRSYQTPGAIAENVKDGIAARIRSLGREK